jgi:hypothetical protein
MEGWDMRKKTAALIIAFVACAQNAMAQGSDYPDPQCVKPDLDSVKPPQASNLLDQSEAASYNVKVRAYNAKMKTFNQASKDYSACIHAYIDKADRDAQHIQDQANAAIKSINAKMQAAATSLNALAALQDQALGGPKKGK